MRVSKTKIGGEKGKKDVVVLEITDVLEICRKHLEKDYDLTSDTFVKFLLPKEDKRGRKRSTKVTLYFPFTPKKK